MIRKALALLLLAAPAAAQVFDTSGREKVNVETGSVTCSQATASNLKAQVSGTVTCDVGTGTQAVSGTVAATQSGAWTVAQSSPPWSVTATNAFALDTTLAGLLRAQASSTSGQTGPLVQGAVTTSAPSYTNGQTNPFSLTTAGALRVDASATTQPVSGTFWQATQPVSGTFWPTTAGSPLSARLSDGSSFYAAPAAGQLPAALDGGGFLKVHEQGTATVTGSVTVSGSVTASDPTFTDATGTTVPANAALVAGTDGTNTRALKTDSGGELQVDVLTIPSVTVGSSALPTGAATAANQDGIIRDGTGDTTQANVSSGRLHVDGSGVTQPVSGTVTVQDGGGSITIDGSISCSNCSGSGASAVDDSAFAVATDSVAPAGFLVDETTPDSADEGDVALARMSANRNAYAQIRDGAGNERGAAVTAANALKVDGSAVTQPVSGTVTALGPLTDTQLRASSVDVNCASGCSGGTQYDEDTATAAAEKLSMAGVVRQDTAGSLVGADQDRTVLSVDASGRLWTNPSSVTQPVSGTVTVTDGSGALNVIVDSSALPSGAATAAKQPAIGTAGSASADVITVQGIASATPVIVGDGSGALNVIVDSGNITANAGTNLNTSALALESGGNLATIATLSRAEDAAHSSGHTGVMALAVREATATDLSSGGTDGDYEPLQVDANGRLYVQTGTVTVTDGAGALNVIVDSGSITANAGTNLNTSLLALESGGNLATVAGAVKTEDLASADGHAGIPALAVRKATPANTSGTDGDYENLQISAGRLWASATIDAALPAGTNAIGKLAANSGVDIGDVDVTSMPGTGTEDSGETAGGTLVMAGTVRRDTAASSAGTTADNATLNTDANGLLWARDVDPCSALAKTFVPVSISTATTTQLVAASASNKVYICGLNLVTAAANNVALVEDDTSACASPTAGMAGGTTAATGWNFAANGGMTLGNGASSVAATAATNRYVCFITSAATQLSGTVSYVLAP